MSKLFYKNSLDWEILLAYFPDQIFFRWKEKSPFRFRDAGVNHSFPFGLVGKWQSLFLPHSAQKLLDSAENWRQRAMVWSSAEKKQKQSLAFQPSEGCSWSFSRKNILWSGKELEVSARKISTAREAVSIYLGFAKKRRVPPGPKMTYCPILCSLNT